MLDYTEDFKTLYTKLLTNYISIKVNEDAFTLKEANLNISINNSVVNNPFDINNGWIVNFIPKDVGIVINQNNKKETFEKLSSEMFCFNSVHIFERMIIMLNNVLLKINEFNSEIIDKSALNVSNQIQDTKKNTILKKLRNGNLTSYLTIELINDIIKNEILALDEKIKLRKIHNIKPFEFLHKMRNCRNAIVHSDGIYDLKIDNEIYLYKIKVIDNERVQLMMEFSSIKRLIEAYKEIIYIFYTALNMKFTKKDELNLRIY
ncbi:hypothetical protein [Chishuiella changwenlii]|uniref:hypothetical protein n=1 Tax=Chishuiella changwenlii TaxID=1434701 RepID=UPI002FD91F0C